LIRTRFLPASDTSPALELLEVHAHRGTSNPPILCVHGAFGGAWMWEEFLHAANNRGRQATAISLRGHGASAGRQALRHSTLADYSADVLRAFNEFDEPPVVIGHSLGALLAQRLLGRATMSALVMLAPLPPEGMFLVSPRLFATVPEIWLGFARALMDSESAVPEELKDLIFSDRCAPDAVKRHLARMGPESIRVLMEAHLPLPIAPALLLGVPGLVIGGSADPLVTGDSLWRTALYHGAAHITAPRFGHLLHLEPGADEIARMTIDWLEEKGL